MIPYNETDDALARQSSNDTNSNNTMLTTGLRKNNPLSDFSSYVYQLTLYMCTPECISRFALEERFAPNEKENFIVAQSGGISETDLRALTYDGKLTSDGTSGPGYDYYIDDLVFESFAPAGSRPTIETKFNFKVVEPLGFTLLTKMSEAAKQINNLSSVVQQRGSKPNLFQQHYVLGIKFFGYDENGNLMSVSDLTNSKNPTTKEYAHFQKYYSLVVSKVTFVVDGKAVVYNFEAYYIPSLIPFSITRGTIKSKSEIVAGTVGEALLGNSAVSGTSSSRSLVQILNEQQFDEKDTNRIKLTNKYNINFIDDDIKNSTLLDDDEYDLKNVPMSSVKNTKESNIKISKKTVTYNNVKKQIAINEGTPVLSVIDNIIAKSDYVAKGLTTVNNQAIETASRDKQSNTELTWYTVIPVATPIGWDNTNNTWVYEITYNIQKHYIPYIRTLYKNRSNAYYGPHKEYNYIFTGLNTEVISYQAEFNTLFYVIQSTSTTNDNPNKQNIDPAVNIYTQGGTNSSLNQGKINRGSEIASNVKSNLNNIADLAKANITIMGDPDFLSQGISATAKFSSEFYQRLYGTDGYSINPYGGQIFIEIIFKAAEDYQSNGLLDVNDSISFYEKNVAAKKAGVKGIVYRIVKVVSTLSKGRFTQMIDAIIVSEKELGFNNSEIEQREVSESSNTSSERSSETPNQFDSETRRLALTTPPISEDQSEVESNRLARLNLELLRAEGERPIQTQDTFSIANRQSAGQKLPVFRFPDLFNSGTDNRSVNQRLRNLFNRNRSTPEI